MSFIKKLNKYGKTKTPILFIIDFDNKKPIILPLDKVNNKDILYNINGISNCKEKENGKVDIHLTKDPVSFKDYERSFNKIQDELIKGNSFLINLTFSTPININLSLKDIFLLSRAKYKLFYKDKFVVFSPEQFVIIENNSISSFPMKGTINADIPNAADVIISNEKEFSEHITIVDLIRNDLGIVSKNVSVEKFRYIDEIKTNTSTLLQVSSKINGKLENKWNERLGEIINALLPAGSVTGAPKKKTVEIIKEVENYDRGYYTGIFGYFDGNRLESSVMIRFIERSNKHYIYKSGGGITVYSDPVYEYNELLDKIYVPIS